MKEEKLRSAQQVAELIKDNSVIALSGSGGGILEADEIFKAIEERFLSTGFPKNLTLVHALGIGDGKEAGINRFAHRGLVRRVIGGHWSWSPRMQQLAKENAIEAYSLPAGVIGALLRESGANRPGLFSKIGLGSFIDPRNGGGKLNETAQTDIVELTLINGIEYLHYLPIKVDFAIIRGSTADQDGNISFENEPALLDIAEVALSARGNGGKVLVQVKRVANNGSLPPMSIRVPSTLTDFVVIASKQKQTYQSEFNPAFNSAGNPEMDSHNGLSALDESKLVIVRRAAQEIKPGNTVNVGFGVSSSVVDVLRATNKLSAIKLVIEQGPIGGIPVSGSLFGVSTHPESIIPSSLQFDSFAAGIIDVAVLGMGELDVRGNVNVSKLAGTSVGPGGFIDIVHGSRKIVFCGTFSTKGLSVSLKNNLLKIDSEGKIVKIVDKVEQITFSSQSARDDKRSAIYVTERAVFELTASGIKLIEVAPGVDVQKDVIKLLPATVDTSQWVFMDSELFKLAESTKE